MKKIVKIPEQVLSAIAKPIESFDADLKRIVKEMKDTLSAADNPKGVGLAGPQIGYSLRIFITKPTENADISVFINPSYAKPIDSEKTKPMTDDEGKLEGCLSVPHVWGSVKRYQQVTLTYQNESGVKTTKTFKGFMAVIIQHEMDHLEGKLFTQRVLEQKGKLYQPATDKNGKEVLEEIRI